MGRLVLHWPVSRTSVSVSSSALEERGQGRLQVGLLCIHSAPAQLRQIKARAEVKLHSFLPFCGRMQLAFFFFFFHVNELCWKAKWEEEKNRVSVHGDVCVCVCAYLYRQGESSRHIIFPFSFN